jgi:O-antigen ligase
MVFMAHGLAVALFIAIAGFAAHSLIKIRTGVFFLPSRLVTWYLFIILILCKSTAAIIYGVLFLPVLILLQPKKIVLVVAIFAILAVSYPILRITNSFPHEEIVDLVEVMGEERQQSLSFRFYNEELMSVRALERPLWGWGGHSRGRVHDERGREITVIDSYWIGLLTSRGLVGMFCIFGILVLPLIYAYRRFRRVPIKNRDFIAVLSLILGVHVLDLLINGLFTIFPFFFAGSLYGATRMSEQTRLPDARAE